MDSSASEYRHPGIKVEVKEEPEYIYVDEAVCRVKLEESEDDVVLPKDDESEMTMEDSSLHNSQMTSIHRQPARRGRRPRILKLNRGNSNACGTTRKILPRLPIQVPNYKLTSTPIPVSHLQPTQSLPPNNSKQDPVIVKPSSVVQNTSFKTPPPAQATVNTGRKILPWPHIPGSLINPQQQAVSLQQLQPVTPITTTATPSGSTSLSINQLQSISPGSNCNIVPIHHIPVSQLKSTPASVSQQNATISPQKSVVATGMKKPVPLSQITVNPPVSSTRVPLLQPSPLDAVKNNNQVQQIQPVTVGHGRKLLPRPLKTAIRPPSSTVVHSQQLQQQQQGPMPLQPHHSITPVSTHQTVSFQQLHSQPVSTPHSIPLQQIQNLSPVTAQTTNITLHPFQGSSVVSTHQSLPLQPSLTRNSQGLPVQHVQTMHSAQSPQTLPAQQVQSLPSGSPIQGVPLQHLQTLPPGSSSQIMPLQHIQTLPPASVCQTSAVQQMQSISPANVHQPLPLQHLHSITPVSQQQAAPHQQMQTLQPTGQSQTSPGVSLQQLQSIAPDTQQIVALQQYNNCNNQSSSHHLQPIPQGTSQQNLQQICSLTASAPQQTAPSLPQLQTESRANEQQSLSFHQLQPLNQGITKSSMSLQQVQTLPSFTTCHPPLTSVLAISHQRQSVPHQEFKDVSQCNSKQPIQLQSGTLSGQSQDTVHLHASPSKSVTGQGVTVQVEVATGKPVLKMPIQPLKSISPFSKIKRKYVRKKSWALSTCKKKNVPIFKVCSVSAYATERNMNVQEKDLYIPSTSDKALPITSSGRKILPCPAAPVCSVGSVQLDKFQPITCISNSENFSGQLVQSIAQQESCKTVVIPPISSSSGSPTQATMFIPELQQTNCGQTCTTIPLRQSDSKEFNDKTQAASAENEANNFLQLISPATAVAACNVVNSDDPTNILDRKEVTCVLPKERGPLDVWNHATSPKSDKSDNSDSVLTNSSPNSEQSAALLSVSGASGSLPGGKESEPIASPEGDFDTDTEIYPQNQYKHILQDSSEQSANHTACTILTESLHPSVAPEEPSQNVYSDDKNKRQERGSPVNTKDDNECRPLLHQSPEEGCASHDEAGTPLTSQVTHIETLTKSSRHVSNQHSPPVTSVDRFKASDNDLNQQQLLSLFDVNLEMKEEIHDTSAVTEDLPPSHLQQDGQNVMSSPPPHTSSTWTSADIKFESLNTDFQNYQESCASLGLPSRLHQGLATSLSADVEKTTVNIATYVSNTEHKPDIFTGNSSHSSSESASTSLQLQHITTDTPETLITKEEVPVSPSAPSVPEDSSWALLNNIPSTACSPESPVVSHQSAACDVDSTSHWVTADGLPDTQAKEDGSSHQPQENLDAVRGTTTSHRLHPLLQRRSLTRTVKKQQQKRAYSQEVQVQARCYRQHRSKRGRALTRNRLKALVTSQRRTIQRLCNKLRYEQRKNKMLCEMLRINGEVRINSCSETIAEDVCDGGKETHQETDTRENQSEPKKDYITLPTKNLKRKHDEKPLEILENEPSCNYDTNFTGIEVNFGKNPIQSINMSTSNAKKTELQILIQEFMTRDDVSRPVENSVAPGNANSRRYRLYYLPLLHKRFMADCCQHCSLETFTKHVPQHVQKLKAEEMDVCVCMTCQNPELKVESLVKRRLLSINTCIEDVAFCEVAFRNFLATLRPLKTRSSQVSYTEWIFSTGESTSPSLPQKRTVTKNLSDAVLLLESEMHILRHHLNRISQQYEATYKAKCEAETSPHHAVLQTEWSPLIILHAVGKDGEPALQRVVSLQCGYMWSQSNSMGFISLSGSRNHRAAAVCASLERALTRLIQQGIKSLSLVVDPQTDISGVLEYGRRNELDIKWIFSEPGHGARVAEAVGNSVTQLICDTVNARGLSAVQSAKDVFSLINPHSSNLVYYYTEEDIFRQQKLVHAAGRVSKSGNKLIKPKITTSL